MFNYISDIVTLIPKIDIKYVLHYVLQYFNLYSMSIQCIFNVYSMCSKCVFNVYSIYIQCFTIYPLFALGKGSKKQGWNFPHFRGGAGGSDPFPH